MSGLSNMIPTDVATLKNISLRYLIFIISIALLFAPIINFIPSIGEELGWRGYLFVKLNRITSPFRATLISGIIWGLWHAPLVVMGLKYGFGYPLAPYSGIVGMTILCIMFGAFLSYITTMVKSVVPATFAHGAFNSLVELPTFFAIPSANPLIGPKATGIVGGIGFIVLGVICFRLIMKSITFCKINHSAS